MKLFTKKVQAVPYSTSVTMVLCDSINEARKELKLKPSDKSNWDTGCVGQVFVYTGMHNKKFDMYLFVNVPIHDTILELTDTFSHEIIHVVDKIFNKAGIDTDYNNNEPYAYTTGRLVQELWALYLISQGPDFCPKEGYFQIIKNGTE